MKAKVKMGIIISVLCLIALISIIAIVAIFAANSQTFSSNISVTYTSEEISGTATAKYYVGSEDATGTEMHEGGTAEGKASIEFNAGEENKNTSLSPVDKNIKLSSTNNFIVFEYYFTNTSPQNDFEATLSFSQTDIKNMEITTADSVGKMDFSSITTLANNLEEYTASTIISAKSEGYFYVKAKIQEMGKDANLSVTFNWNLALVKPTLEKLTLTLNENTYSVKAANQDIEGVVVIPSTYLGKPVTSIEASAFYNTNITKIIIPEGIKVIGSNAFEGASKLTSITTPESLEEFAVEDGRGSPFLGCSSLTNIVIKAGHIPNGTLFTGGIMSLSALQTITFGAKTTIDDCPFDCYYDNNFYIVENIIIESKQVYSSYNGLQAWDFIDNGKSTFKILTDIDDGSNEYLGSSPLRQETINGKTYNIYESF